MEGAGRGGVGLVFMNDVGGSMFLHIARVVPVLACPPCSCSRSAPRSPGRLRTPCVRSSYSPGADPYPSSSRALELAGRACRHERHALARRPPRRH
jgi:hypothetical protein